MKLARVDGSLIVRADAYTLTFAHDRPFVYLDDAAGQRLAELFVLSSVHSLHALDDTTRAGDWSVEETSDWILVSLVAFGLSGLLFGVSLAPAQKRLLAMAREAEAGGEWPSPAYRRLSVRWEIIGIAAILLPLAALALMVFKPASLL